MVKTLIYALACLSLASFTFANKGDNKPLAKATACDTCVTVILTDTKMDDKPTLKSVGRDTSNATIIATSLNKSISREELVYMVDSILDLDSISPKTIAMLTFYSAELSKPKEIEKEAKVLSSLPATDFYESFDETTCFVPVPEQTLPDTLKLVVSNDSLGDYFPPICGVVTSNYGWRDNRMHKGMDINLRRGDIVHAAFGGMVRIARYNGGYGNVVIVRHYNGLETVYAHLSKIKVKTGQVVISGQVLGLGGATGHATGNHLHFEVRFKGHALNPANFISFTENKILNDTLIIRKSRYGVAAFPSNATVYTVQRGDSWYEVAKRYGLTTRQLGSLNGTDRRFYLRVGQKIRIN
ncbi:MAG TPA: M23 family metallopeptidase [Bacteroidia bacterium]|jgi:murein DD-endopeptidase MepM/ murein hydrolase activator NlpD|nr:M23 family metallopeptidase [Bacteroidia bacterium]